MGFDGLTFFLKSRMLVSRILVLQVQLVKMDTPRKDTGAWNFKVGLNNKKNVLLTTDDNFSKYEQDLPLNSNTTKSFYQFIAKFQIWEYL